MLLRDDGDGELVDAAVVVVVDLGAQPRVLHQPVHGARAVGADADALQDRVVVRRLLQPGLFRAGYEADVRVAVVQRQRHVLRVRVVVGRGLGLVRLEAALPLEAEARLVVRAAVRVQQFVFGLRIRRAELALDAADRVGAVRQVQLEVIEPLRLVARGWVCLPRRSFGLVRLLHFLR